MKPSAEDARLIRRVEDRAHAFVRQNLLWTPGQLVVLAVSGGADSLCMMHLAAGMGRRDGAGFIVAHLHHGMRGQEADDDERFVAEQAAALGLRFIAGHADVPALARERQVGLEEAGRIARREFLDRSRDETGADAIATAHTLSDHVETILLHLFRGAGLQGLAGIPPRGFGGRVRPILCLARDETEAVCLQAGLQWRSDRGNHDMAFLRNRIRHHVLPALRAEVNPAVDSALCRLAAIVQMSLPVLEQAGSRVLDDAGTGVDGAYSRERIRNAGRGAATAGIRLAIQKARGTADDVAFADVERVLRLLDTGGQAPLTGGAMAECSQGVLVLSGRPSIAHQALSSVEVAVPGAILWGNWEIAAGAGSHPEALDDGRDIVCIGARLPLFVRPPASGDRVRPTGRGLHKTLKALFQEAHVPVWERAGWPVIEDADGIAWIPQLAVADRMPATPAESIWIRAQRTHAGG